MRADCHHHRDMRFVIEYGGRGVAGAFAAQLQSLSLEGRCMLRRERECQAWRLLPKLRAASLLISSCVFCLPIIPFHPTFTPQFVFQEPRIHRIDTTTNGLISAPTLGRRARRCCVGSVLIAIPFGNSLRQQGPGFLQSTAKQSKQAARPLRKKKTREPIPPAISLHLACQSSLKISMSAPDFFLSDTPLPVAQPSTTSTTSL